MALNKNQWVAWLNEQYSRGEHLTQAFLILSVFGFRNMIPGADLVYANKLVRALDNMISVPLDLQMSGIFLKDTEDIVLFANGTVFGDWISEDNGHWIIYFGPFEFYDPAAELNIQWGPRINTIVELREFAAAAREFLSN